MLQKQVLPEHHHRQYELEIKRQCAHQQNLIQELEFPFGDVDGLLVLSDGLDEGEVGGGDLLAVLQVQVLDHTQEEEQAYGGVEEVGARAVLGRQHGQVEQRQSELVLHELPGLGIGYMRYSRLICGNFSCRSTARMQITRAT